MSFSESVETTEKPAAIGSIFFDFTQKKLEINGKPIDRPVVVRWPEALNGEAWQRGILLNESREEGARRCKEKEELPVLTIAFQDGTGSCRISDSTL